MIETDSAVSSALEKDIGGEVAGNHKHVSIRVILRTRCRSWQRLFRLVAGIRNTQGHATAFGRVLVTPLVPDY